MHCPTPHPPQITHSLFKESRAFERIKPPDVFSVLNKERRMMAR
jgi:hypothetical protein